MLDFYTVFMQDIHARSGAEKNYTEATFTERMCDFLVDQAILEDYTCTAYKNTSKGLRIDAFHFNEDTEILHLFATDFRSSPDLETLIQTEVTRNFKRLEKFFSECLNLDFLINLEESSPGYETARYIYELARDGEISRVQLVLLTNASLSKRVTSIKENEISSYPCSYDIWDMSRLHRLESSGKAREDVVVDMTSYSKGGLPCLQAFNENTKYASYLLVVPGNIIADLYDQFGEMLLEQNVRTFLQFRGKVNKGIRNTIQNEPEMFFAYNNGLSATAEEVKVDPRSCRMLSVTNLQVVNGGQTTASIFTAYKKLKTDLSKVYVQVKLTVIQPEKVEVVVPKISEYANTQNRVSAADFFSNHPFHLRIEEISRRLWAPSPDGSLRETHWFYERARGQFANAQALLTPAKKKEFLSKNPRSQMFAKTDLAKFEHSFAMIPHTVSLGAQKNFAAFASKIGPAWEKNQKQFNELYYKNLIAKAILFRFLDKNIMRQPWYGGYKANIVTYSIAKFAQMVSEANGILDLPNIWKKQKLSQGIERQLLDIATVVNKHIQATPEDITNVTEWCKKEWCWNNLRKVNIPMRDEVTKELLDRTEHLSMEKSAEKVQEIDNGIISQAAVLGRGPEYWKDIARFGLDGKFLTPKEMSIVEIACAIPDKLPTEKQCNVLLKVEKHLIAEGFFVPEQ